MAPCVAQVFPACAQQAAALLPSPLPGIPAEPQCQRTAWSCLGISHLLSASFTTPPPRRRVKSCLATGEACCASARWGGRNAGAFGSSGCFLKLACSCKSFPTWLCRTGWSVRCMAEPGHSHPCCCHPECGHSAPRGQLLAWGQSCHRAVLATQKALPWGGRCDDGKDEVGGHSCAAKKPILSAGFALGPAAWVS